jgi:hypothetical protein
VVDSAASRADPAYVAAHSASAFERLFASVGALSRPRPLLALEHAFLAHEFGESLDLSQLRLFGGGHPVGRIAWQPGAAWIQMDDQCFEEDDPGHPVRLELFPVLAHEALHVWQRVHKQCSRFGVSMEGLWLGVARGRVAYEYDREVAEPAELLAIFQRANIEQQAQIFEDYVRSNVTDPSARAAKFEDVARYVRTKTLRKIG